MESKSSPLEDGFKTELLFLQSTFAVLLELSERIWDVRENITFLIVDLERKDLLAPFVLVKDIVSLFFQMTVY